MSNRRGCKRIPVKSLRRLVSWAKKNSRLFQEETKIVLNSVECIQIDTCNKDYDIILNELPKIFSLKRDFKNVMNTRGKSVGHGH